MWHLLLMRNLNRSLSAARQSGGFTLVELLVVIGIIAILAGVALGPITNGIKKAKESAAMQTTRTLALAEFQYSNDNNQTYPDGADAGAISGALFTGNYVSDPGIFIISGDSKATKYSGTGTFAATGCTYDYMGVTGGTATTYSGVGAAAPDQTPLVWSQDTNVPAIPTGTAPTGAEFAPNNPLFGSDGIAVAYHSNNAYFRAPVGTTPATGAYPDTKGDALFIDNTFNPQNVTYAKRLGSNGF
jgi:prepilin-type N-terminal cleavage/methylation domain-containing protein